jgi:hypothetical protein
METSQSVATTGSKDAAVELLTEISSRPLDPLHEQTASWYMEPICWKALLYCIMSRKRYEAISRVIKRPSPDILVIVHRGLQLSL